ALSPADAAGQEATRRIMAGSAVRVADVAAPRLVRRGENVTIALVSGALRITSPGRALADAARGEPVRVLNLATNRTLEGTAAATGEVRIALP
ncbi:flagellar basal body P-ring formation chaperone FlgA, partial [Novosphingobium sp. HR1a]